MESSGNKLIIAGYSEYPGPRYCVQGDNSGEDFYHSILNDAFYLAVTKQEKLTVDLDGTAGYASSFLDEAFGNLSYDYSSETVKKYLVIISNQEPDWKDTIMNHIIPDWEQRRTKGNKPKKTHNHAEWYRLENGTLTKKIWS
ncbi:MAG: STAS-like domain-containing protein [Bacteroidales bacterium]|nr:STAS-like domain-containing protein [Bacteroidales bacterium]